jgi:anti-anti-sigma factor
MVCGEKWKLAYVSLKSIVISLHNGSMQSKEYVDMTIRVHTVAVRQLPELMNAKAERVFFRELEICMNVDYPSIVLDCSKVRQMDKSAIRLLLCCLEEAMKRNGNVKLAAMPPEAESILNMTGVSRLFEIFDTITDAADSFHQLPLNAA